MKELIFHKKIQIIFHNLLETEGHSKTHAFNHIQGNFRKFDLTLLSYEIAFGTNNNQTKLNVWFGGGRC